MKCTRNCRTKTGNENKCERFADADDLGWMKKFCVISSANPSEKTTCVGDSGSNNFTLYDLFQKTILEVKNVHSQFLRN